MSDFNLEGSKEWYYDAVHSSLILRRETKQEAEQLLKKYMLKERLDQYPQVQLHYDVEATADEVLEMTKKQ